MSARLNAMFGFPEDPRQVQLVRGLLEKTRQAKVGWVKQGEAYTASLPNGIVVNFVLAAGIAGMSWQLFTVRDKQGNELVSVNSWGGLVPVTLGTAMTGSLLEVTNELFLTVRGAASDDLDRAIESLKKL